MTRRGGAKTPEPGGLFRGDYEFVERIGEGGMGLVWAAKRERRGKEFAIKLMKPHPDMNDEEQGKRLDTEVRAADVLNLDGVAQVIDAGFDEEYGCGFIVMDRLSGRDLRAVLKEHGRLSVAEVLDLVRQVVRVLEPAREARLVHRDLKPANLFLEQLTGGGTRLKVMDWGTAKFVETRLGGNTVIAGTPCYWAPEQQDPLGWVDHRADLFALGQVVFELLVGKCYCAFEKRAVDAATVPLSPASAVARAKLEGVTLPAAFDAWFFQATARDREARYDNARELAAALKAVFEPPHPPPPSWWQLIATFWPYALAGAISIVVIAAIVSYTLTRFAETSVSPTPLKPVTVTATKSEPAPVVVPSPGAPVARAAEPERKPEASPSPAAPAPRTSSGHRPKPPKPSEPPAPSRSEAPAGYTPLPYSPN